MEPKPSVLRVGRLQQASEKELQKHALAGQPYGSRSQQDGTMSHETVFTIGKLAKLTQLSTDTVRYYEKEGLINPAQKSQGGYRLYTNEAVRRLSFIKHAQHCGLSLSEIRELLDMKGRDDSCCGDIRTVALHKKLLLESKIKALQAMSNALNSLIDTCNDDAKPLDECPILAALENNADQVFSLAKAL